MKTSLDAIIALIERHSGDSYYLATEYGEPGYDHPRAGWIVMANWNGRNERGSKALRTLGDWLEHHGYGVEWSDEWITDDDGRKAYRTVPDGWSWRPSYTLHECTVFGHTVDNIRDCIREYKASRDGDEWGTCMAWRFAIAHEIYARGLDIPDEWQFQPGAACHAPDYGREWDRWETEYCATVKDRVLERFGELLHKHSKALKERGLSY